MAFRYTKANKFENSLKFYFICKSFFGKKLILETYN
jgi:hypothetical protein